MIALAILAFMAGAALGVILGVILMGMVSAGRREDECKECKRAFFEDPAFSADRAWLEEADG